MSLFFGQRNIPYDELLIDADCEHARVIFTEDCALELLRVPVELNAVLACLRVPNEGCLVFAGGDQEFVGCVRPVDAHALELRNNLEHTSKFETSSALQ